MGITRRNFVTQLTVGLAGLPFVRWYSWAQVRGKLGYMQIVDNAAIFMVKESQMSYPDPRSPGDEGEISTRYRVGSFSRIPLAPPQLQERVTPTQDVFVLCHLGVPQLEADSWSLTIDGLVARPHCLGLSDLTAYPRCTITSFHQCCGSPLKPLTGGVCRTWLDAAEFRC
jgi:DMSO/TMAO reductase YedYZ molybdopterin-dependent catalytic subunit